MRRIILLAFVPLFAVVMSFAGAAFVNAQSSSTQLTKEQEERIRVNCVSLKATLNQLHASDALLRVNRGQIYESMASNLMDRFNARLSSNSLDNRAMTTVTTSYRTALTNFRNDYIKYEQKLSQAIRIDCSQDPTGFYAVLQEARTLRSTVHEDVGKLHQLIDDYRSSVSGFLVNYERISN